MSIFLGEVNSIMPVHSSRHGRGGFTIVELLVVVSIIVLLLAILTPSLSEAIRQAEYVVCQSNMRQLQEGLFSYVADNRNTFPIYRRGSTRAIHGDWGDRPDRDGDLRLHDSLLWPYAPDLEAWICPVFQSITQREATRSYTSNYNIGDLTAEPHWRGANLEKPGEINQPGSLIYFCEENPPPSTGSGPEPEWYWSNHPFNEFANVTINDGQMFASHRGRIGPDGFGTFHRPKQDRYAPWWEPDLQANPGQWMYTGLSNVSYMDGHVGTREHWETQIATYNDPNRVTYGPPDWSGWNN